MEQLIPKLRFPEFSGEWEKKRFNELYEFKSTNSLARDKFNYENGSVQNIHYGDIHTKFKSLFNIKNEFVPYINKDIDLSKIKKDSYVQEGDLIIADASENYEDIGKTIEIISLDNHKVLSGLHTFLARRIEYAKKYLVIGWITYFMKSAFYKKQVYRIAQGTKVLSLSSNRVGELKIMLPSLPEQQKIADYLSTIDKKLELLREKRAQLECYKKGMMQQLFSQQIRFKDDSGKNYPDWQEKKLGEIADIITGSTPRTNVKEYYNGNIMFVSPADILDKKYIDKTSKNITEKGLATCRVIPAYSIVFVGIGSVGKVAVVKSRCATNQQIHSVISKEKDIDTNFVYYQLSHNAAKIAKLAPIQVMPILNKTEFSQLYFFIPSLPEQQKIAEFLSALDTKIEGIANQIEQTEAFKKAMLQQLFV